LLFGKAPVIWRGLEEKLQPAVVIAADRRTFDIGREAARCRAAVAGSIQPVPARSGAEHDE
jgi:hypothetical protein